MPSRPELNFDIAVGLNQYERAPDLLTWHAGGLYHVGERATIGFQASREALLPFSDRKQLRQFNRVLDLESGPGLQEQYVPRPRRSAAREANRTRMETGIEKFQDGNRSDPLPFYYSPGYHLTIGTMLHTIRRPRGWVIESDGLLNIGRRLGPASLTGGAFVFRDGLEKHLQWRLGGRVSVPLAH